MTSKESLKAAHKRPCMVNEDSMKKIAKGLGKKLVAEDITFTDVFNEQPPLMNKLSQSPHFHFNQSEIASFRAELLLLDEELSRLYSARNVMSLLTQADKEETLAVAKLMKKLLQQ